MLHSWASRKISRQEQPRCLTHSHKYLSPDALPFPSQWPRLARHERHPWCPMEHPGPATRTSPGLSPAQPKHELSRKAHVALAVGSRSQRRSVGQTKLGLVFFLCSVCLSAAHVVPGNTKPPVSDYKYTINAISDLFFCRAWESKFGVFLKNLNLTLMYSDCHCKYRCFCYAQAPF